VEEDTPKALWAGDFAGALNLQNLARTWEQALAGRSYESLPVCLLYRDTLDLKALLKFGARLMNGIKRHGNGKGSFTWVVHTATDLLDSKPSATCDPADIDDLVQWWVDAALAEAGRMFAAELRKDADFSVPLLDVFLSSSASCIVTLMERKESLISFDKWATTMPNTLRRLLPSNNTATMISPSAGPVIKVARVVPIRTIPAAGPGSSHLALAAPNPAATAQAAAPAPSAAPAVSKAVVGSHQHHVKRADALGVVHKKTSKNTHIWLAKRKCKIADLEGQFGTIVCLASIMSSCNGKARFSACDMGPLSTNPHPDHSSFASPAHQLPASYRNDLKRYFC